MPIDARHDAEMASSPTTRELLAANLRALREALGNPSQGAIAKRAGVDQTLVSRALANSHETGVGKLDGLAKAVGVQAWQLICPGLAFLRGADNRMQVLGLPAWPFTDDLRDRVERLGPVDRLKIENTLRVQLDLPVIEAARAQPPVAKRNGTHG